MQIPDLVNIQRTSFQYFVQKGLLEAFKKINPMRFSNSNKNLEIIFFPEWIQFRKPEFTSKQCLRLGKTYGSSVYLPVLVKSNEWDHYKLEWLLLGFLPLMTKQGHFVINGIPRVVLHQMVRNPGVYLIDKDSRTRVPTIRIVPEQGSWINITLDKKYRIWFTTRLLRRKVSILILLRALGISLFDIYRRIDHSEILQNSLVKDLKFPEKTRHDNILSRAGLTRHPYTQEEAWRYLYAHFQEYTSQGRDQTLNNENAREFFFNILWNPKRRNLGKIGRQQFREKLSSLYAKNAFLHADLKQTLLTADDIVLATEALIQLVVGERLSDDIDSLLNKRIRGCGDFLQEDLIGGLREFEIFFSRKLATTNSGEMENLWRFNRSSLSKFVSKAWKSFFTSGTLSQFMDETNPLAEITHKRRLTVLGPGGVSSKQTTIQIRGIHPTYYGRLCPIETPEGQNAGLVNSFTIYTERDFSGNLKTPFYRIYKGQRQQNIAPFFMSPHSESSHILAPADIQVSNWKVLPKKQLPVRKDWKFDYAFSGDITTQSIGILQMISVATSLIPFLEHDDANRALMGSNMQRQAVPVIRPESSFVRTGLESRVVSDVKHNIQAFQSGYTCSVESNIIKVIKPKTKKLPLSFFKDIFIEQQQFNGEKKQLYKDSKSWLLYAKKDFLCIKAVLTKDLVLDKFKTMFVLENQNKISNGLLNNKYNLAQVTKTNYWKKYYFNLKNDQKSKTTEFSLQFLNSFSPLAKSNLLLKGLDRSKNKLSSSMHKKSFCASQKNSFFASEFIFNTNDFYFLDVYQRTNQSTCISHRPVIDERDWIQAGDLIADGGGSSGGKLSLGKNVLIAYLPWEGYNFEDAILISEKLVYNDSFTSLHIDEYEVEIKNTQYGLETITNKIPIDVDDSGKDARRLQKLNPNGLIEIGNWVEEGDYLVGKVSPMSPKGPSIQQQYEKLYNVIMQRENTNLRNTSLRVPKGVEGFVLDVQLLPAKEADVIALAPKNSILRARIVLLQKRKIQVGDKMAGRHGNKGVISKILSVQDMPYLPDGTPIDIVLNPLGVPSRMNVGQILECLLGLAGLYLNESYTIDLFDEKYGAEASRSLVYSKLYEASIKTNKPWLFEPHHPGKIKIFDGRTGDCFDQAVTVGCAYMLKLVHLVDDKIHARATGPYSAVTQQPVRGRSKNGGQRLGEMEVWALQAYGAAYTLQELLTIKSDDLDGRKETVFRIYTNQSLNFGQPESFRVLIRELQALCFDLKIYHQKSQTGQSYSLNLKQLEKLNDKLKRLDKLI